MRKSFLMVAKKIQLQSTHFSQNYGKNNNRTVANRRANLKRVPNQLFKIIVSQSYSFFKLFEHFI